MSTELSEHLSRLVQNAGEDRRRRWLRVGCWTVCIVLALLETWSGRYYVDPDGISYLDMSDAFLRHNWHLLINSYWSPLYPFLIGLVTRVAKPSAYWELPLVHAVNFLIFIAALASFEFLLRQVIRTFGPRSDVQEAESCVRLPVWMWQLLGYGLFAWSTFVLISGIFMVTPDMLVVTFLYLDAGLLLQLHGGDRRLRVFLLLGLTLGLGYWAKAILFPMAFVFIATAFLVVRAWRKGILGLTATFLVFVAVSAPLIAGISKSVGRPSFGESGRLNYTWFVDGERRLPFYSHGPSPQIKHPLNRIHEHPNVFEFRQPFEVTYPLWFGLAYWNSGLRTRMNPKGQLRVIGESLVVLYYHLVERMWGLIGGFCILLFMSPNLRQRFKDIVQSWPLVVPGVVGLCLYLLVGTMLRYIGPFVVFVWLGLFSGIRLQKSRDSMKLGAITSLIITASMMVLTVRMVAYHLGDPFPFLRGHGGMYYHLAESLRAEGLRPGDAVAIMGNEHDQMAWARAARVRIIAQMSPDDVDEFWRTDAGVRQQVFDALAAQGAKAVVTDQVPFCQGTPGWEGVGDTTYFVHFLVGSKS